MDELPKILFIVALIGLVMLIGVTMYHARKAGLVPNYRSMFVLGFVFLPFGIVDLSMLGLSVAFLVAGWRHKDKWGQHTRWADFPPTLKRLKLASVTGAVAVAVSMAVFFIAT